jgi:hypothetical protein
METAVVPTRCSPTKRQGRPESPTENRHESLRFHPIGIASFTFNSSHATPGWTGPVLKIFLKTLDYATANEFLLEGRCATV